MLSDTRREDSLKYRLDREKLIKALEGGTMRSSAAVLAGVPWPTLHRWLKEGQRDQAAERETYCAELLLEVQRAEAKCEQTWLEELQTMALSARETDWRSRSWLLATRHARKWARRKAAEEAPMEDDDSPQSDGSEDSLAVLESAVSLFKAERAARGE